MPMLDWIGKDKVINHHNDVPYRVLDRQYSYDSNGQTTTDNDSPNMIIQGDNLEALKSLLPRYEGRVKCIYIDPPYNTGNENWIYNDNVNSPQIQKWLGKVVGAESKDLTRHDKWLCMMYPRLKLLHKLLADDGAIFISIDDIELFNLKIICDEIFGSNNFITNLIWQSTPGSNTGNDIKTVTEYVLMYAKKKSECKINVNTDIDTEKYIYEDEYVQKRGKYILNKLDRRMTGNHYSEALNYSITTPDNHQLFAGGSNIKLEHWNWRWSKEKVQWGIENGFIVFKKNKNQWSIYFKQYMYVDNTDTPITRSVPYINLIKDIDGINSARGTQDTMNVFNKKVFDYPKPINLLEHLIKIKTSKNDLILDSFAGSGTTAHAVLNLNKSDGGNRKFILIEMLDYAEGITAERVKRVIKGYGEGKKAVDGTGGDFSFYKLGEQLLIDDELNENLPLDTIRKYIWFTETRTDYIQPDNENPYFLGDLFNIDYYFYYEKDRLTTLNKDFLATFNRANEEYIIYADICTLSDEQLLKYNITFKKIPRDITKF